MAKRELKWRLIWGTLTASAAALAVSTMAPTMTTAQVSRSVQVKVVDASGTPVVNALVCIGTANDRAALGGTRTNASGTALLTIPAETGGPPQVQIGGSPAAGTSGALLVTGGTPAAGNAVPLPGLLALVTLRIPTSGGPACPSTAQQAAAPGQIAISRPAIDRALAANAARPPISVIGPINLGKTCFGAAGQNCGGWTGAKLELSSCNPLTHTCAINAGSWQHDECCVRNPQGAMCDDKLNELVGSGQICQAEFELAVQRLGTPFTWSKPINFETRNTTGIVNHAEYCAPAGTFVNITAGEQRFCCTRQARPALPLEMLRLPASVSTLVPVASIRICT